MSDARGNSYVNSLSLAMTISMLKRDLMRTRWTPFWSCSGMSSGPGAWTLNSPALMPISWKTLEKSLLSFWDSVWPPDHMSYKIKFRFLCLLLATRTQFFCDCNINPIWILPLKEKKRGSSKATDKAWLYLPGRNSNFSIQGNVCLSTYS